MPFFNGGHIWIIAIVLIIVLIIWGPGKLPDVGSGLGRAIHEFRKASTATRDEFAKATRPDAPADPAAAPAAAATPSTVEPATVGAAPTVPAEHRPAEGDSTAGG